MGTRALRRWPWLALLALVTALVMVAAACGGDGGDGNGAAGNEDVSGSLSVLGIWAGQEQESFQAVIDSFTERYPKVSVSYNSAGDNLPTVLRTAVDGGNPPDVAFIAQPGTIQQFADDGALQSIEFARDDLVANFGESIADIGTFNDTLYGVLFKSANKSLGWYNTQVFADAGVEPPTTIEELEQAAQTIAASGVRPYSIAGADGWTLTDLFENVYLRTAGPELYDQLASHEIPWTHPSVVEALERMQVVIGNPQLIAGGAGGALQTDFPRSVTQVFSDPPDAAMVFEGDFVAGNIANETNAQEGDFGVFTFPEIDGSPPVVVGAGDIGVLFRDSPAGQAFIRYLTTPEAAEAWASRGGFLTANQNLDPSVYPDDITRQIATDLAEAETFRFDLSDLTPPEFGGTPGQGLWQKLQSYLRNPGNPEAIARQIERDAARAYR